MSEYRIFITSSAKRATKKLPLRIRKAAIERINPLKTNPYSGEKLTKPLHFLFSLHFKFGNVQYQIAYTVDKRKKIIVVHLIGPRENFYRKLQKLFK